jgi:NAD-dependent deacetylase sirtuin 4
VEETRSDVLMQTPFLRIPFTNPLPAPRIFPATASSVDGAVEALHAFLLPSKTKTHHAQKSKTVILSGAGISVASGLADYRGQNGTYTLNKTYRPIYYNEFVTSHEARKRYWARSLLGWPLLQKASPNQAHFAVAKLGQAGIISHVITQSLFSNVLDLDVS